jgi:hypothetical protein
MGDRFKSGMGKKSTHAQAVSGTSRWPVTRGVFEGMAIGLQIEMALSSECPQDILVGAAAISESSLPDIELLAWAVALNHNAPPAALQALRFAGHSAADCHGDFKSTLVKFKKWLSSYENYQVHSFSAALDEALTRAARSKFPDWDEYDEEDGNELLLEEYREYEGIVIGFFLRALARDTDEKVREAVAVLPQTPADALEMLATDPSARVRKCVARNAKVGSRVLSLLAADTDRGVADVADKKLGKRRR